MLTDGAALPAADRLPEAIRVLLGYQAHVLRQDKYDRDLDELVGELARRTGLQVLPETASVWREHARAIVRSRRDPRHGLEAERHMEPRRLLVAPTDDEWYEMAFDQMFGRGDPAALQEVMTTEELARATATVLVGDAGMGKSTLLRMLAVDDAQRFLAGDSTAVPILANLALWPLEMSLIEYLQDRAGATSRLSEAQRDGKLIYYLDAANELRGNPDEKRARLRQIVDLQANAAPSRCIVSTRPGTFTQVDVPPTVRFAHLLPLSPEQVAQLFERARDPVLSALSDGSAVSRELLVLATNPYFAQALVELVRRLRYLPENCGDLMARLVEAMTARELRKNSITEQRLESMLAFLRDLALRTHERGGSEIVGIDDAHRELLASAVVTGFVLEEEGRHRFAHSYLQSFLAAQAFLAAPLPNENRWFDAEWTLDNLELYDLIWFACGFHDPRQVASSVVKKAPGLARLTFTERRRALPRAYRQGVVDAALYEAWDFRMIASAMIGIDGEMCGGAMSRSKRALDILGDLCIQLPGLEPLLQEAARTEAWHVKREAFEAIVRDAVGRQY